MLPPSAASDRGDSRFFSDCTQLQSSMDPEVVHSLQRCPEVSTHPHFQHSNSPSSKSCRMYHKRTISSTVVYDSTRLHLRLAGLTIFTDKERKVVVHLCELHENIIQALWYCWPALSLCLQARSRGWPMKSLLEYDEQIILENHGAVMCTNADDFQHTQARTTMHASDAL